MYKFRRVLLIAPAFNEEAKIGEVVRRAPRDIVDTVLVVDDCSTDRTAEVARARGAEVLSNDRRRGVGYAIRRGYKYARTNRFDIVVVIAGNNKDAPEEIARLLDPICEQDYDFVMGSRYLPGAFPSSTCRCLARCLKRLTTNYTTPPARGREVSPKRPRKARPSTMSRFVYR
jgi:dolichol-phosphate mannosyltransferase